VGSSVTSTVLGAEFQQMREEFNIEMCLVAVAERNLDAADRMLLSVLDVFIRVYMYTYIHMYIYICIYIIHVYRYI